MKCLAEVMVLGVREWKGKADGKLRRSVEVSAPGAKALEIGIPDDAAAAAEQAKGLYGKLAKVTVNLEPGKDWGQFFLRLEKLEPLPAR